jgi:hypothetical protein
LAARLKKLLAVAQQARRVKLLQLQTRLRNAI